MFLRARYYDIDLGRFITRDPFAGFMDDPQTLNRYIYGGDNPVNHSDPSGRFVPLLAAAAGVTLGVSVVIAFLASPEPVNAPGPDTPLLRKAQPGRPVVHALRAATLSKLTEPLKAYCMSGLDTLLFGMHKYSWGKLLGSALDEWIYGERWVPNPYYQPFGPAGPEPPPGAAK
jgi:hypothetical protein